VLFLRRCARHPAPLFELSLFSVRGFGLANAAIFVFSIGFSIMLLSNVLWCQEVWHYSPLRTGFAMAPGPALVPVVTLLSARAVHRYGTAPVATAGSVLFAAGMLWQAAFLHTDVSYAVDLLPSMVLGGTGVGLALSTLIAAGVTSLPAQRSATGSAVVNAGRQVAAAVGVAVLVSLVGVRVDAGSLGEFRAAWLVAALFGLLAAGLAAAVPRPRPVPAPAIRLPASRAGGA
jgi:MFS family permease